MDLIHVHTKQVVDNAARLMREIQTEDAAAKEMAVHLRRLGCAVFTAKIFPKEGQEGRPQTDVYVFTNSVAAHSVLAIPPQDFENSVRSGERLIGCVSPEYQIAARHLLNRGGVHILYHDNPASLTEADIKKILATMPSTPKPARISAAALAR
ncbi:MAG: hypothetical protein EBQ89_04550 [Alphaproteobacteria bacterium]|nr:hypothetical protein [Alphaproteobacteria bacterium]